MFWLQTIGIPYLTLMALTIFTAGRGRSDTTARIAIDIGIDSCILGIGVTSGVFVSTDARAVIGDKSVILGFVFLLLDLIITGICLRLREFKSPSEVARARLSVFLGVLIFAINTGIVLKIG